MFRFAIPALLLVAGCAPGGQIAATSSADRLDAALAGLVPGETQRCINTNRVTQTQGYRGAILFVEGDDRKYRTDVTGCDALARGDILVARPINPGQYCQGDIVQTRSQTGGQFTGSCALGAFTAYTPGAGR